ncbi:NirD/YgiW/YdeI family stress tolerance protein [Enterovibrio coralii]|nr:NirD/YgiW/YdeI family stress tolerance protein [Enterovibrio coralii]
MFSDDQPVSITGYITLSLGGEIYIFQDVTGVIHVEIDQDANNAQNQSRYPRRN